MKNVSVVINPLRSPAAALLLCLFFGPLGVIYTSVWGAVILLFLTLIAIGSHSVYPIALMWILSCFWGVIAANRHNRRIMEKMRIHAPADTFNQDTLSGNSDKNAM